MSDDIPMGHYWRGKNIEDMDAAELRQALIQLGQNHTDLIKARYLGTIPTPAPQVDPEKFKAELTEAVVNAIRGLRVGDLTNPEQDAEQAIMSIMLALPSQKREEVWGNVAANGIFCVHCGTGEPDSPNPRCQCWNDE